jgi:hypothetical protein
VTIKIKQVNGIDVPASGTIELVNPSDIRISGDGLKNQRAICTQIANSTVQHLATGDEKGNWEVKFNVDGGGTYSVTCRSKSDPSDRDSVQFTVTLTENRAISKGGASPRSQRFKPYLAFDPNPNQPHGNALYVAASGSVLDGQDSVTCTLTPINSDGTTDNTRGSPQSNPAFMNGTSWTVFFMPPPSDPGTPPNLYVGLYSLEATAPNEGSIIYDIDIPQF